MKHKTIPIFVPHMGCKNDCAFCNQRSITGIMDEMTAEKAEEIIMSSLATMPKDAVVEIGFFGGSFTGINKTLQRELLSVAKKYVDAGTVSAIRISTRPDYIDEDVLMMLKSYGVQTIELGAQSMEDDVLLKNHRGHTSKDTVLAAHLIKRAGFGLGLQMMTGLFGDTEETVKKTADTIISLAPECVRIYPTLVLKHTRLAQYFKEGIYVPQTLEDAVSLCADLKAKFEEANILVIRMGLMASDNINPDSDVLAGPYHPAFGELVKSEIYFRNLKDVVENDCEVLVNPRDISAFVGNKQSNIKRMKEKNIHINFKQSENVPEGTFQIIQKKGGAICD